MPTANSLHRDRQQSQILEEEQTAQEESPDVFSRLPYDVFGRILLLVASNGNDFTRCGSNGQDCLESDDALRQKIIYALRDPEEVLKKKANGRTARSDFRAPVAASAACPVTTSAFETPLPGSRESHEPLVIFHHALVSKRWLRVPRSVHPALVARRNRRISSQRLASALLSTPSPSLSFSSPHPSSSSSSSSRFPSLRHLHLGLHAIDTIDDALLNAIALGCGSSLTNISICADTSTTVSTDIFNGSIATIFTNCTRLVDLELSLPTNSLSGPFGHLPSSISCLERLTRLSMTLIGDIATIPPELGRLRSLRRLTLVAPGAWLLSLSSITALVSLEELYLGESQVSSLPRGLGQLKKLKSLVLNSLNWLVDQPSSLCDLEALTHLQIDSCSISCCFLENIGQLKQLKFLQLYSLCHLTALPDSMGELPELIDLEIRDCNLLAVLPSSLPSIATLRRLTIHDCREVSSLPDNIGQLLNLQELDLRSLDLSAVPESLGSLTSLKKLTLWGFSKLTHLPQSVSSMQSLAAVCLNRCPLQDLPTDFGQLNALKELRLIECSTHTARQHATFNLSSLEVLVIKAPEQAALFPASFPSFFGSLPNLRVLELYNFRWTYQLPESLSKLPKLGILRLNSISMLQRLPCQLGQPHYMGPSLRVLEVCGLAALDRLPASLTLLTRLEHLSIRACTRLQELPEGMGSMASLREIQIRSCHRLCLFPSLLATPSSHSTCYSTSLSLATAAALAATIAAGAAAGTRSAAVAATVTVAAAAGAAIIAAANTPMSSASSITTSGTTSSHPPSSHSSLPLPSLLHLSIRGCSALTSLPVGFHLLPQLTTLVLENCYMLKSLPHHEAGGQKELVPPLSSSSSAAWDSPSTLDFVSFPASLTSITISRAFQSTKCLPASILSLPNLHTLTLRNLSSLQQLLSPLEGTCTASALSALRTLCLEQCPALRSLPSPLSSLPVLTSLTLRDCSLLVQLPDGIGQLKFLEELSIESCQVLQAIPQALTLLTSLKQLSIIDCPKVSSLPNQISSLVRLSSLQLNQLPALIHLPSSLAILPSLRILSLEDCSGLQTLPEDLGRFSPLESVHLEGCKSMQSLPVVLGIDGVRVSGRWGAVCAGG